MRELDGSLVGRFGAFGAAACGVVERWTSRCGAVPAVRLVSADWAASPAPAAPARLRQALLDVGLTSGGTAGTAPRRGGYWLCPSDALLPPPSGLCKIDDIAGRLGQRNLHTRQSLTRRQVLRRRNQHSSLSCVCVRYNNRYCFCCCGTCTYL